MDDKTLAELKDKVNTATQLQKKIQALDEVMESVDASTGFMNITANYKNQNEIRLVNHFDAKEIFDAFGTAVQDAARALQLKLAEEYQKLK